MRAARSPGCLDEAAFGGEVAAQRMQGAARLERLLERVDDLAVRRRRVRCRVCERRPVDGRCLAVHVPASNELADHGARAARAVEVLRHPPTRGREARDHGRAA